MLWDPVNLTGSPMVVSIGVSSISLLCQCHCTGPCPGPVLNEDEDSTTFLCNFCQYFTCPTEIFLCFCYTEMTVSSTSILVLHHTCSQKNIVLLCLSFFAVILQYTLYLCWCGSGNETMLQSASIKQSAS